MTTNVPFVAYQNLFESASTVTASSEATGFLKENAYDWLTYDWWKPNATSPEASTLTADMGSAKSVDYGAIFGHDLHTQGATIKLQYLDSSSPQVWTTVFTVTPTTSAPIVRSFTSISAQQWRYEITGGAAPQAIAVLAFGARLDLPTGTRPGFTPTKFARQPDIMNNRAEQGAFIGRRLKRRGVTFNISIEAITPLWLRTNWGAFQDHFEGKPFFYSWDPTNYEDEAVFCWTDANVPAPVHSSELYLDVRLPCSGLML